MTIHSSMLLVAILGSPLDKPKSPANAEQSCNCPAQVITKSASAVRIETGNHGCTLQQKDCKLKFYFQHPAEFVDYTFGFNGEPIPVDGVLIHEGMGFAATADGNYHARFVVTAPDTAVTIRLKLQFNSTNIPQTSNSYGLIWDTPDSSDQFSTFTINLPVLTITPKTPDFQSNSAVQRENDSMVTYTVELSGFSPALKKIAATAGNCQNMNIQRTGTARLGSVPVR